MKATRTYLAGFDFGTTTSTCVLASVQILKNVVNGKNEFADYRIEYEGDTRFTPIDKNDSIDLAALDSVVAAWLKALGKKCRGALHGSAIVTGLTARKGNADKIRMILQERMGE